MDLANRIVHVCKSLVSILWKVISRDPDRLIVKSSTSPDNSKTTLISSSTAYPTSYPRPILQKCLAGIVKIVLNVG